MQHFKIWFLASALLGSVLAQGCVDYTSGEASLEQTRIESSVLANVRRADGAVIPDIVQAIQDQYGFRAQVMNFVIPNVTIVPHDITQTDVALLSASAQVTGWQTFAPTVINDAQSFSFTLQLNGAPATYCQEWDSGPYECRAYRNFFWNYLGIYSDLVHGELNQHLSLEILGEDAQGNQRVLSLAPATIAYECIADLSKLVNTGSDVYGEYFWVQQDAAQCAGKVTFAFDAPSAKVATPTREQLERVKAQHR